MKGRRFPPPWTLSDIGTSWCVTDASGFDIVYFVYDAHPAASALSNPMTREETYAMAANFARLPELLRPKGQT